MKLSLNWLKQYIDHGLSAEDLSFRMTMAGLEVEHIEKIGNDTVFEIEITPNRPDCLNMLGLAREISAIVDKDLKVPAVKDWKDLQTIDISIEDTEGCGRYIGTLIEGVSVKPFPADKSLCLQSLGNMPVSNIVDSTNFALFEFGQPLHAFDYDKLAGGKIIVRRARKGESIITLDNVERKLDESILVIADAERPVAIAGIMGGRDTGVSSSTQRILLEAAFFDMGLVRKASRKLGLSSDSCYRFERGIDWTFVESGSNRATDLILAYAGGKVAARRDVVSDAPGLTRREVKVTQADICTLLGAPLDLARAVQICKRLGCDVILNDQTLTVQPPHFRNDIHIKEDIIEEIARVIGYDNLPMTLPQISSVNIAVDWDKENFNRHVSDGMIGLGFNDTVTYALVGSAALEKTEYEGEALCLLNPMSAEQEIMRPTSLPNFLLVAAANINRGQKELKLFEIGKRYLSAGERWTLAVLVSGRQPSDWRAPRKQALDFYDVKGVLEQVLGRLRVEGLSFVSEEQSGFEQGARITIKDSLAGRIGKVSKAVLERFDIKNAAVFFAEIDLELAVEAQVPKARFMALDEFPVMTRDVSLAVRDVSFDDIKAACLAKGGQLLKKISFVELYTGDKIEAGVQGYVLSFVYQSSERTLTDAEVSVLHESLIQHLVTTFGVVRR